MNLEQLIAKIESDIPDGWGWLLRSNPENDSYFANIMELDRNQVPIRTFPARAHDPFDALKRAYARASEYLDA